jgi:hypothetical protein
MYLLLDFSILENDHIVHFGWLVDLIERASPAVPNGRDGENAPESGRLAQRMALTASQRGKSMVLLSAATWCAREDSGTLSNTTAVARSSLPISEDRTRISVPFEDLPFV